MAARIPEGGFIDYDGLKAWLDFQPKADRAMYSRIVAYRASMRALPFIGRSLTIKFPKSETPYLLIRDGFRAALVSRMVIRKRSRRLIAAASSAVADGPLFFFSPLDTSSGSASAFSAADSARSALEATISTAALSQGNTYAAATASSSSAHAAGEGSSAIWNAISLDVELLLRGAAKELIGAPIWPSLAPSWWTGELQSMNEKLAAVDGGFGGKNDNGKWLPWLDWYTARALGKAPWGLSNAFADRLEERIALGDNREGFWARSPDAINSEIGLWVDGARLGIDRNIGKDRSTGWGDGGYGQGGWGEKQIKSIARFIIDFLQRNGGPASIDQIREAFSAENYPVIDKTMRGILSRLALRGDITRIERGLYEALEYPEQKSMELPLAVPQTSGAIQFDGGDDEPISVRHRGSVEEWDTGLKAAKRHTELLRLVEALLRRCQERMQTTDSVRELLEDIQLFRVALGETVHDFDPDFAIPRGDGLRQMLSAYEKDDNFSRLPPISDDILLALGKAIPAYNQFISLDDHLAKRDEALLGPDARKRMVGPIEGQPRIEAAVEGGAAKQEVRAVLEAEAIPAPDQPDPENRASRRYSEGNKNFARRAIEKAWEYGLKAAKSKPVVITTISGGAGYKAATWVWDNKDWLLSIFAENPVMLKMIKDLLEILAKLPLG